MISHIKMIAYDYSGIHWIAGTRVGGPFTFSYVTIRSVLIFQFLDAESLETCVDLTSVHCRSLTCC